ncbi:unnamed protein product [Urochloa decumbens]|uniref:DUF1618 domain-containing protein n=1 Tax=Urochloa decumbens TaxID=240449 RepID=A0ABC9GXG4_9POAL
MSGHHRRSSGRNSRYRSSTPTSKKDDDQTDAPGHHHRRRLKRSSDSLSVYRRSPDYRPSWAILSVAGAQRDDFPSDRATSAISLTSSGGVISVSFDLVEPPGISVLALDPPRGPGRAAPASTRPDIIAAHRDVVLVKVYNDYFVYQANSDPSRRLPSLLLLPGHDHEDRPYKGRHNKILLRKDNAGIMSCRRKEEGDNSFVVARLYVTDKRVDMFWSGSGKWEVFKNLHVHGANGGRDIRYWSTDAVVADYQCRFLIWVDYYRGMILMDMSPLESEKKNPPLPRLRITTWSLREDDYTRRKDTTMYEEEFLTMLRSEHHRFPRVTPEHPVVNMENPDVVCFRLKKDSYSYEEPTWMVEVDVKKKVLLAATPHTKTTSSSGEEDAINSVRIRSHDLFFSTELPRYLDGGGQACKIRRQ